MDYPSFKQTHYVLAGIGLFSALPALYFVIGSILKYELDLLPNAMIHPFPPTVLLGGLLLAVVLNVYPTLRLNVGMTDGALTFSVTLNTRSWNFLVFVLSILCLTILVGYVIMENLTPH